MTQTAASEFIEDQISSGGLRLHSQERYADLDFAHSLTLPEELRPKDPSVMLKQAKVEVDHSIDRLIRGAYHGAIALLFIAILVGTIGSKPLVAYSIGFLALSLCGFANYAAGRFDHAAWIPVAIASRLAVGAFFLAITALLVALFN
ncbi:MAG: hypothetical protein WA862_11560 [Solirubrobacterales bacterium]